MSEKTKKGFTEKQKETIKKLYSEGKFPAEIAQALEGTSAKKASFGLAERVGAWCRKHIPEEEKWAYGDVKMPDGKVVRKRVPKYTEDEKKEMAEEREAHALMMKKIRNKATYYINNMRADSGKRYTTEEKETMMEMYKKGKTPAEIAEVIKTHYKDNIATWCRSNIPEEEQWVYKMVKTKDGKEVRQRVPKYTGFEKRVKAKERKRREADIRKMKELRKKSPRKKRKPLNDKDKKMLKRMYHKGVTVPTIAAALDKAECIIYRFIRANIPEEQRWRNCWVHESQAHKFMVRGDRYCTRKCEPDISEDDDDGDDNDEDEIEDMDSDVWQDEDVDDWQEEDNEDDDDDGDLFPTSKTPLAAKKDSTNPKSKPSTSAGGESSKSGGKPSRIAAAIWKTATKKRIF